jgi:hypothetical protein
MHQCLCGLPYLLIRRCPFPVWGSLDFVILYEYKIEVHPLVRNVLIGTYCRCSPLEIWGNLLNWNCYYEFLWPSCATYSWMVIQIFRTTNHMSSLNQATPSVGVYLVSKYRVRSSSPFINSGTISHSGHHARPPVRLLRSDTTLNFQFVYFGRTPRQYSLIVSRTCVL